MERALSQFDSVVALTSSVDGTISWRANEKSTNRPVVIRKLDASAQKTRATQSLALAHPNIVPSRRWIQDGSSLFVVRDFVSGVTAAEFLRDTAARAFDRLRRLFDPVLDALEHAHTAGLVHGHLSDTNIIVTDHGPVITDFARPSANGTASPKNTPATADYKALCQLYKNYLADAPADDEARIAARTRLLRNLTEMQQSASTADELRYKLDAITRMAELLGFSSTALPATAAPATIRLGISLEPTTATVAQGSGCTVILALDNTGDTPIRIQSVESGVVWMNLHGRFEPVDLVPDQGCDLLYTVSAARLASGTYSARLTVNAVAGVGVAAQSVTQVVSLPVIVSSKTEAPRGNRPMAENLSEKPADVPRAVRPTAHANTPIVGQQAGLACIQEPDPALVVQGQLGVMHLGVTNTGQYPIRVDKIATHPNWLQYPGELRPTTIDPSGTQYFGFSVVSSVLTPGDYKATIRLTTSTLAKNDVGTHTEWRETPFDVRVRVIRSTIQPIASGADRLGCAALLTTVAAVWVILSTALVSVFVHVVR